MLSVLFLKAMNMRKRGRRLKLFGKVESGPSTFSFKGRGSP
jgi:hypothetical protein